MKIFSKMRKMGLLPPLPPELIKTHEVKFAGVTAGLLWLDDNGHKIGLCWFHSNLPAKEGDYLIIHTSDGRTVRYVIHNIETPRDPGDQHFLECTFAPRPESEIPR